MRVLIVSLAVAGALTLPSAALAGDVVDPGSCAPEPAACPQTVIDRSSWGGP